MSHLLHVFPLISLHELTPITDAYQWNAHDHFEQTMKQIMQIIHCNYVKPRYQQSRLSLRYQIFPLLIQEGLYKVLEVEPFRVIGSEHPLA